MPETDHTTASRPVGRPANAAPGEVLAVARRAFRAGERMDLTAVATELGLSRATVHRWFGTREQLISAVLIWEFERGFAYALSATSQGGGERILDALATFLEMVTRDDSLRMLLQRENALALRVLTAVGPLQRTVVGRIQALIDEESAAGRYVPPIASDTLAYAMVRLVEAFIYNDTTVGLGSDVERLLQVERLLLRIDP